MKKLLLIAALAASFTASATDYDFYERGFIESCLGIGTLIPSQAERSEVVQEIYIKKIAGEESAENVIFQAGTAKGMVLGTAMSTSQLIISVAVDRWEGTNCDKFYSELEEL